MPSKITTRFRSSALYRSSRSSALHSPSTDDPLLFRAEAPVAVQDESARPIIVFCHLGWEWVWQRPQQFMSRLAQTHRVLFVEWGETSDATSSGEARLAPGHPNVTIFHGKIQRQALHDDNLRHREQRALMDQLFTGRLREQFRNPILWFYDPLAFPAMAGRFGAALTVYDCMDELSQFKGAPPGLIACERQLVEAADVVFCGGQRMRTKRLPLNPNCHFFGTGVDCAHFGMARRSDVETAPEIAGLGSKVLGYFGVVDERMDYELLTRLADAHADWSVAIVGPCAKVDPESFPRRPNLHFLGARNYADLPAITRGFSVCLMPFALNAATEFINPTKALEYMAAGKPVVSTALQEVALNFAGIAAIARTHDEFVRLCEQECAAPSRPRIQRGLKLAQQSSWESIIAQMEALMAGAIARRAGPLRSVATTGTRTLNPAVS